MPRNKPRYKKRSVRKGHLVRVKIKPTTPTAVSNFEKEKTTYAQNVDETTGRPSNITMFAYNSKRGVKMETEMELDVLGPKPKPKAKKSFKYCNGFYKDGQCFRNRAAYREYKKHKKGK
tara:strand:+ start:307 stop:663 length:357 start_codon:yes stop_codon:yes gene_type:complete